MSRNTFDKNAGLEDSVNDSNNFVPTGLPLRFHCDELKSDQTYAERRIEDLKGARTEDNAIETDAEIFNLQKLDEN